MTSVVSNTSPIIALDRIGHLHLLEKLFQSIAVPPAVVDEIGPMFHLPAFVVPKPLVTQIDLSAFRSTLGQGEREAIALALETRAPRVILDDRPARRNAQSLGLSVIGTLGVLLSAKRRLLIPAIQPCLNLLMQCHFRIAPELYRQILVDAGE